MDKRYSLPSENGGSVDWSSMESVLREDNLKRRS